MDPTNDTNDGTNRRLDRFPETVSYVSISLNSGAVLIYDPTTSDAWLRSDRAVDLASAR